jgi:hypothetical protein
MSKLQIRSVIPWALGALLLAPEPASACGGFFCSQATPVNQAAEQIIFSQNADDTVTAVISIQYQGDAERFAWVLPIAGVPEVEVSSNLALQRLLAATTPQYTLSQRVEGTCRQSNGGFSNAAPGGFPMSAGGASAGGSSGASGGPQVSVVAEGSVGPYDFVAISVSEDAAQPAQLALEWLEMNEYDVSALGEDILGEYLMDGLNLLAFRLTKGNDVGAIRPVRVTYPAQYPVIPIRPTAVAANDDMGVMVYMVAEAQAIPQNYKSLVLNEALINWFNFAPTYNAVITRAANEAQGQGFVSEFAGPSLQFNQSIWSEFDQQNWEFLQSGNFGVPSTLADGGVGPIDGKALFNQAAAQYGTWDGFRDAVTPAITLPSDVTLEAFLATPWLYQDDARIQIDGQLLLAGLQENVIDPMIETQQLLISRPYLTRLFTTMSAEDMTVDPLFSINPDLEDISNVHTAEQIIECSSDVYFSDAPWRIDLPQGGTIRGVGSNRVWPFDPSNEDMPANRKIVELSESGSGDVVVDNSQLIWRFLNVTNLVPNPTMGIGAGGSGGGTVPIGGIDPMVPEASQPDQPQAAERDDSGCSLPRSRQGAAGAGLLALLAAAALSLSRRRSS